MPRKRKRKTSVRKRKKSKKKEEALLDLSEVSFSLPEEAQKQILGILFLILAVLFGLSFFNNAGIAGEFLYSSFSTLVGGTVFILPVIFGLGAACLFSDDYKEKIKPCFLAAVLSVLGISGTLESLSIAPYKGGMLGSAIMPPLLRLFGAVVAQIILAASIVIGTIIFWRLFKPETEAEEKQEAEEKKEEEKPSFIKKIFSPSFKVKKLEPAKIKESQKQTEKDKESDGELKPAPVSAGYEMPPIELLDAARGKPTAGDIKVNSSVIKKTFESFDIPVEMAEVSIGPTVTQYSFKPAEGIKLSKITSLSNDLALALAAHPIRIEAPIPGKSLVGVEVPNKVRAFVRLKEMISDSNFQGSHDNLTLCFGNDVSGSPVYTNLAKMPHLLVAGSTGTGKTIFLNNLIVSLLYKNSPDVLKLVLIDPKRVEFIVYNDIPHLLTPVIVDSQRATNALKWLTEEMDRRFRALAQMKSKNILSYNEKAAAKGKEALPYVVVVIDELADLMAAKGREVESAIVRLAQMARAVGIHLVVATQRPSVEVITGLIKANITSRVTFQVASQVDSRTILDTAGAEKLLGLGDMLFISNDNIKPKRVQGAYISEKEVKRITQWIKGRSSVDAVESAGLEIEEVQDSLSKALDTTEAETFDGSSPDDPLYEDAIRVVVEAKRASASLLQRKLRVGYARAARLIDALESNKIIGPSRGSKPREVYHSEEQAEENPEEEEWKEA